MVKTKRIYFVSRNILNDSSSIGKHINPSFYVKLATSSSKCNKATYIISTIKKTPSNELYLQLLDVSNNRGAVQQ
ncbi:hypothetical protein ABE61_08565 [Lysinibacillus sphaericus]|nr:hypothetical protein [Lysinibacillus sphaericus]MBG9477431.1 hypothetical protein [Lysinibacillus sphaericus]MBG9593613.1 hypothetical protein [Lysinibacillus sphaericus]